ncbi:glycosyltransferase family 2 protein [Chishuiella sp.]|uniref:glycosyltransferase family 2 protein n=1 Tax=Chishuiella sp. TaxID=1969467 RepID=UPI0028B1CB92|nr:glycosyltransferase family 2 protein [Chishuiella sp.]
MSIKISALLITYNEEDNILRFLDEASYAEEIIIVDSFSTDKTEELAIKNPKVHFVKREFDNFTNQRNYALSLAKNDWVTFFDADEELSKDLINEILLTVKSKPKYEAYYVYRKFFFKDKCLSYSGMQSDKAVRLFNKSKIHYKLNHLVHEQIDCVNEMIGCLKNKLDHHTFNNEKDYLCKLNSYSRLRAKELYDKKLKPNFFHFKIKPAYRFFNYYIIRLGFLDGKEGYVISKLHAISVANRYKYLDEIYKKNSD